MPRTRSIRFQLFYEGFLPVLMCEEAKKVFFLTSWNDIFLKSRSIQYFSFTWEGWRVLSKQLPLWPATTSSIFHVFFLLAGSLRPCVGTVKPSVSLWSKSVSSFFFTKHMFTYWLCVSPRSGAPGASLCLPVSSPPLPHRGTNMVAMDIDKEQTAYSILVELYARRNISIKKEPRTWPIFFPFQHAVFVWHLF